MKCYHCKKEDIVDNLIQKNITEKSKKHFHLECYDKYLFEKNKCPICKKKMITNQPYKITDDKYYHLECYEEKLIKTKEQEDWQTLYEYVKVKILGYNSNMSLSKTQMFKLRSLREGKLIVKGDKMQGNGYSYKDIHLSFILCKGDIDKAIREKEFRNENEKFNYIIAIIRNRINDIILNKQKIVDSRQNVERHNDYLEKNYVKTNEYIKKTNLNDKLENLIKNW